MYDKLCGKCVGGFDARGMPTIKKLRIGSSGAIGAALSSFCLISLLLVPFVRAHDFGEHLRLNEARRETIRHTCIETGSVPDAERTAQAPPEPNRILPVLSELRLKPIFYREPAPTVQINRLLMRYKLGNTRAGDLDPLL